MRGRSCTAITVFNFYGCYQGNQLGRSTGAVLRLQGGGEGEGEERGGEGEGEGVEGGEGGREGRERGERK